LHPQKNTDYYPLVRKGKLSKIRGNVGEDMASQKEKKWIK